MSEVLDAAFFAGNRQRLRELFTGTAPIVLTANGLLQRSGDVTFPYRQDSNFWYLTGIDEPDVVLVMDKGKEYLIIPERDEHRVAFDGQIENSSLSTISGIESVLSADTGWKQLEARLQRVKHVATLAANPSYVSAHGFYSNPARARLIKRIKSQNADIELLDLRMHVARMRMVKQPAELAAIQQAIDITVDTLQKFKKKRPGTFTYEFEAEAFITAGFKQQSYDHAYQPIVASGQNACTLHYTQNSSQLVENELVLLDVGAEVNHYAADITRTYSLEVPTKRQQQVYDAVLAVQEYALDMLKPGVILREYEQSVALFMGEKLRELGLIKSIESDAIRQYYPHATSHFLGLDVHDVADYELPLEAGMVLTVEPGIYIPEESIGIRIEDDVVVEESGVRVLSAKLPRVLE